MLLSLRKRLAIVLCRTHVAVVLSSRGWRPRSLEPEVFPCTPVVGEPDWLAPVAALRQWLAKNQHTGALVDIIVSDSLIHYALIPWSDDVDTRAERIALSRIYFETLFGTPAGTWEIHADSGTYGRAGVACAVDKLLIAALRDALAVHGLRLTSVQPYFMRVFNRWRNRVQDDALFVVVESGQCVMASRKDGAWHSIRSARVNEQLDTGLALLIERETLLQGLGEEAAIYVHAADPVKAVQLAGSATVTMLEASPPTPQQAAALAMCGAI